MQLLSNMGYAYLTSNVRYIAISSLEKYFNFIPSQVNLWQYSWATSLFKNDEAHYAIKKSNKKIGIYTSYTYLATSSCHANQFKYIN